MINSCDKDEIICLVDGDDFLEGTNVLNILSYYYSDPNTWLTYGQYQNYPVKKKIVGKCKKIKSADLINQNIRMLKKAHISHLKTFYAGLFQKIDIEDLKYQGSFIPSADDVAFMCPMIDMATTHTVFISQILYNYNTSNPSSHGKLWREKEIFFDKFTRSKPKYVKLNQSPAL